MPLPVGAPKSTFFEEWYNGVTPSLNRVEVRELFLVSASNRRSRNAERGSGARSNRSVCGGCLSGNVRPARFSSWNVSHRTRFHRRAQEVLRRRGPQNRYREGDSLRALAVRPLRHRERLRVVDVLVDRVLDPQEPPLRAAVAGRPR